MLTFTRGYIPAVPPSCWTSEARRVRGRQRGAPGQGGPWLRGDLRQLGIDGFHRWGYPTSWLVYSGTSY